MDVMDIARFWSHVDVKHHLECWPWRAATADFGHGIFKLDGKPTFAHRVAFEMACGKVELDAIVRHTCDNPGCCNPKHLISGTHADNVRDRVIRDRSARGDRVATAKLTADKVLEIRCSRAASIKNLAERYGVTRGTIEAIRYGRSWRHLPAPR